jgi:hypothetical protein
MQMKRWLAPLVLPHFPTLKKQSTMSSRTAELEGLRILSLGIVPKIAWYYPVLTLFFTDGGDARCISELHLLNEFMNRLEDTTGKKLRPCNYFRLIVGSGAAG